MKAIAEDSKMVALATSEDSGAMRTIAVVTMIFLPATFTAVSMPPFIAWDDMSIINPVYRRRFSAPASSTSKSLDTGALCRGGSGYIG